MGDFYDLLAPQWVDFNETCSPMRIKDFFDREHTVHERIEDLCDSSDDAKNNTIQPQPVSQLDVTCASTKAQADLDIIKSTPIKVISPKNRNNKEVIGETTYDQVLSDAMRKLELCKKPPKIREALNKTTHESNTFKTPNKSKLVKSSRSVGCRSVTNKYVLSGQDSLRKSTKVNKSICTQINDTSASAKEMSVSRVLLKQDENHTEDDTSNRPNDLVDDTKLKKDKQNEEDDEERNEKNNEEHKEDTEKFNETDDKECNENDQELQELRIKNESEELTDDNEEAKEEDSRDDVDAAIENGVRTPPLDSHMIVIWQNYRRSLKTKPKRCVPINKKYVSLAEAVSRFQTETPERFRTRSGKPNVSMPVNMSKLTQNRLKTTIPISPALVSKTRTRPVTVLSREEREKLEMEEMKKHRIKANPIPPSVLRSSRVVTKTVAKKSTAAVRNSTRSNEKACATNVHKPKSPQPHRDKVSSGPKNMVTKVVTDPSGITVEREEITFFGVPKDTGVVKNATRIVPFSFEARNKDLQMKKEQRLKSLQEANKTKTDFHARPVPNFSKPPTPVGKQQQRDTKKSILPCPFSFDDRDRKVFERKEQLVKQMLEEDKRARVFRANPAPVFKPVMVRGRSKEHLLAREKSTVSEQAEDQENKEPNVESMVNKEHIPKSKNSVCTVDKAQKAPLKAYPPKLNTDKRARERYEFDEKMRRREMEEEAKRQEEEKKRLESEKEMKAKLRKLTEVKARPMPAYKAPIIAKATKQLTDPQSPAFASKLRSKQT
ncbi:targeting protein for Xklp2 homolog [Temnothorax americanus]|uniref:targeting protein for Xklp2 homolog n=1 Tax=Temnothorax americanus TaxID=1964332 RepID=UPI004068DF31